MEPQRAMTVTRRSPYHNFAGVRLPSGTRGRAGGECFRCSEDRRVLGTYLVGVAGKTIGSMRLCGPCVAALTPLDPDPLDVTEVA